MKNSKKYISWFTVLILGLFFTMQFIPAKGIAASEENTAISFRFEGVVSSYDKINTKTAATLDFSGVAAFLVTNSLLVQCSIAVLLYFYECRPFHLFPSICDP